ncbi:MAG: hypothetical protein JOY84_04070 [Curvibacter sp.]|nr:hypothetical protein [Curvibacter sp.]
MSEQAASVANKQTAELLAVQEVPMSEADWLADGALRRFQRCIVQGLTRLWPTRRRALCPPAFAGLVCVRELGPFAEFICNDGGRPTDVALLLHLPLGPSSHLAGLASVQPEVLVQPTISMNSQDAYLAWTVPVSGDLPCSVWVAVADIMGVIERYAVEGGLEDEVSLPVVWTAAGHDAARPVAIGHVRLGHTLRDRCQAAMSAASTLPVATQAQRLKGASVAERYGERPWLFLTYELTAAARRVSATWAPVLDLSHGQSAAPAGPSLC